MDLMLAVAVWAMGAWLAYRCVRGGRRADPWTSGGGPPGARHARSTSGRRHR